MDLKHRRFLTEINVIIVFIPIFTIRAVFRSGIKRERRTAKMSFVNQKSNMYPANAFAGPSIFVCQSDTLCCIQWFSSDASVHGYQISVSFQIYRQTMVYISLSICFPSAQHTRR